MSGQPDHVHWIRKGDEDFLCIKNNLAGQEVPWAVVAFHAQQAAEKYLKAFLSFKGDVPKKIHDLGALLQACLKYDPSLNVYLEECYSLNDAAADSRYEEFLNEYDASLVHEAIQKANKICDALRERM